MGNKVEEQVKNIMSIVFEIPVEQIQDVSSPDTIELWDSLRQMNLIVALEEEFEIMFTDDETIELLNFVLISNIISNKLNL